MSNIASAYDQWAAQYDTNHNRTRDLEAACLRALLADLHDQPVLELGCGTGKNTAWFAARASHVTAVDFSAGMLAEARQRVTATNVQFVQADLTLTPWPFAPDEAFGVVTFSLVLEHIEHLAPVFVQAAATLAPGGLLYMAELHPCKQYGGSQARFDTADGARQYVTAYVHHTTDYLHAAETAGLRLHRLAEFFDEAAPRTTPPRLLAMLFTKP